MSDITVIVGGADLSAIACESLSFGKRYEVGDAGAQWTMPFPKFAIPTDYASTKLYDTASGNEIWRGRFRWELPDWDGCSAIAQCRPEGLAASLTDEVFSFSVQYGPQIKKKAAPPDFPTDVLLGTVVSLTPEGAVTHAVTQLCPSITTGAIATTGALIPERTRDFIRQNALTVIKHMSGLFDYLATPFAPAVRKGVFSWTTMPGGTRYEVKLADGAKVGITRSPEAVSNRVVLGYGRQQAVVSPDPITGSISYADIPIIRDKTTDVSGQVSVKGVAQQVADGILSKGPTMQFGWNYRITIPRSTPVLDHSTGLTIKAWMMDEGEHIRIPDIDNAGFGKHPPDTHFITEWTCDSKMTVTVTCGETRSQEAINASRFALAQADPIKDPGTTGRFPPGSGHDPNVPWPGPKYAKNDSAVTGGNSDLHLETGPVPTIQEPPHAATPSGDPRGVDYPYSTERKILPQVEPGQPPAGTFILFGADLKVVGIKGTINVPPAMLLAWSIDCSVNTSFTLKVYTQSTNTQIGPAMALPLGSGTKSAGTYTYHSTGYQVLGTPVSVPFFDRWAIVVDVVAPGTIADDVWGALHLHLVRLWPGYPDVIRDPLDPADFIIDVPFGVGKDAA